MKISQMVKKLNSIKKQHGDLEVFVDLKNVELNAGHDEYTLEEDIHFKTESIGTYNADDCTISKRKRKVLSIYICDGVEF